MFETSIQSLKVGAVWSLVIVLELVKSKVHSKVKSSVAELSNQSGGSIVIDLD